AMISFTACQIRPVMIRLQCDTGIERRHGVSVPSQAVIALGQKRPALKILGILPQRLTKMRNGFAQLALQELLAGLEKAMVRGARRQRGRLRKVLLGL